MGKQNDISIGITKMNGVLVHATAQMNLKTVCYMKEIRHRTHQASAHKDVQNRQSHRYREQISSYLERERGGEKTPNRYQLYFGGGGGMYACVHICLVVFWFGGRDISLAPL